MGSLTVVLSFAGPADPAAVDRAAAASPHRGTERTGGRLGDNLLLGSTDDPDVPDATLAVEEGLAASFTGPLDNAEELATQLGLRNDSSNARIYLEAHRRWGDDAPRRMRGPFAGVVTDGRAVWCSRDPFGLKPLFFRRETQGVIVATEARQVLAGWNRAAEPDLDVVERIVFREYDDETPSALAGVERVPRGTTVRIDVSGAARHRFWDPRALLETARLTDDEIHERFQELMAQAARRAMQGDDVVSLSGGVDSSAVAAYAAPEHLARAGRPLAALSVVYPNLPEVDERGYIERTASFLGLELHTYEESSKTLDKVDEWMAVLDSPLPQFFLPESAEHYRKARSLGFRTMLTGELAEWIIERRQYLISHLLLQRRFGPLWAHLARQRRVHGVGPRGFARQLGVAFMSPRIERAWTAVRPASVRVPDWIDEGRFRRVEARYATPARERWAGFQVAIFKGPDLAAEAEDAVQAVTGVRARRPFGDLDLVEFFLSLPAEQKFPDTHFKGLLRGLVRGRVPDMILDTPSKAVFNDAVMARADIGQLRRLLIDPPYHIPGIRYDVLAGRLEAGDLEIAEYEYAKNLAATHAFLARW